MDGFGPTGKEVIQIGTDRKESFGIAAIKAGMDEKTARKYQQLGRLPSELETTTHMADAQRSI